MINVEKASIDRVLNNNEIRTIITAVGTGIGTSADKDSEGSGGFDLSRLRYHKIILMTDADVDGSHIRTLLLTFFFRKMPELVALGHIYVAQPPLFLIKRKKREEYVDDNETLDKILIELGTEEVSLVRLSDKKTYNKAQLMDVLVSLQELEKLSRAVTRRGAKFEDYLEARNAKTGDLPKYIAKLRKQTEETFEFLMDDKEVAKFRDKMGIEDEGDEDEKEEKGGKAKDAKEKDDKAKEEDKNRPKARIYEIYEASSISKVLQGLGKKGMAMDHFSAQDKPLFELIEGEGDKPTKTPIFSIAEILTGVKNVGKRGVQITRFKGLGEMDAKELFSTTMDPEKRQLLKVDLVDAAKADEIFTTLMGDEVEPRRIFIEENALNVRNLDI